jgi:hypothetical protein
VHNRKARKVPVSTIRTLMDMADKKASPLVLHCQYHLLLLLMVLLGCDLFDGALYYRELLKYK